MLIVTEVLGDSDRNCFVTSEWEVMEGQARWG